MSFPDEETSQRIRELKQAMPAKEQRRMIADMQRLAADPVSRMARDQMRMAMEAVGGIFANEHQKLVQQAIEIAKAIAPDVRRQIELASWVTNPAFEGARNEQVRLAAEIAKSFAQIQTTIAPEILATIRAVSTFDDSSVRLAIETIRNLHLEHESPTFQNFVKNALKESRPLTKKTIKEISKTHLSKKKISRLSLAYLRSKSIG